MMLIKRQSHQLYDRAMLRKYGYFHNGLERKYWWWELLVKRIDVLLVYIITYVRIFAEVKSKLVLYLLTAAIFLSYHAACRPYDKRSASLLDWLEGLGLQVRFYTLLLIQLLLLFDGGPKLCLATAVLLLLMNGMFVILLG